MNICFFYGTVFIDIKVVKRAPKSTNPIGGDAFWLLDRMCGE